MMDAVAAGCYQLHPRVVMGDLNDILSNREKFGGPKRSESSFAVFRSLIKYCGLQEIKAYGGKFTWMGHRHMHLVKSRIDRVFGTDAWKDMFPKAYVKLLLLPWQASDHRPLLLFTEDRKWKGVKQFRYDNRWSDNPDIRASVQQAWQRSCQQLPPQQFHTALKQYRGTLAQWKTAHNCNSWKRIFELTQKIQAAYQVPYPDFALISDLKSQLQYEYQLEEDYWRMKSRVQWEKSGDKNTRPKVSPEMNQSLTAEVTEAEVYQAIHLMSSDKAPGPDGLSAGFYKHHWSTIGTEKWTQWIMECISSVIYSVLINGSPSGTIFPQRGLFQAIRRFWWYANNDRSSISWIAWDTITNSKRAGGLGFRDLKDFNILAKQSWRILMQSDSLLARVFKSKSFPKTSLMDASSRLLELG